MGKMFDRAYGVLQADKTVMSPNCKALALADIQKKLEEFFELSGEPQMEIVKLGGEYRVRISFAAERIKYFQVLK